MAAVVVNITIPHTPYPIYHNPYTIQHTPHTADHFNQGTLPIEFPTGSKVAVSSDGSEATGDSYTYPIRGKLMCEDGKHEWRVMVAGSNRVCIGVVRSNADTNTGWRNNPGCWGIFLCNRDMFFAGQYQRRSEGPDSFKLPCEVAIILDCDTGTLSVGVEGQMPVTVVCTSLPKHEELQFGCATCHRACSVEMLSYKRN